jgi:hypothetical protein
LLPASAQLLPWRSPWLSAAPGEQWHSTVPTIRLGTITANTIITIIITVASTVRITRS